MNACAKTFGGLLLAMTVAALSSCSGGEPAQVEEQPKADKPAAPAVQNKTTITFWHAMKGRKAEILGMLVDDFNVTHPKYKVEPVYKGGYDTTMAEGIKAWKAKNGPAIIQIFEVGTANMMYAKGMVKPFHEMAAKYGSKIDFKDFVPAVSSYYSDKNGNLYSMPFNTSTPVLYYNKELFKKAGLDPEKPPKTWAELEKSAMALKKIGHCGYTTTWPSWIYFETMGSWHNIPYASKSNGFDGLDARIDIEEPVYEKLMTLLTKMTRDGTFSFVNSVEGANGRFISGECGIFTASSSSNGDIRQNTIYDYGMAPLPYFDDIVKKPYNTIVGGASLWLLSGQSDEVYKGAIEFFDFLAEPNNVSYWSKETGYIPVTKKGYDLNKDEGFYKNYEDFRIPLEELSNVPGDHSKGVRLGYLSQIRALEDNVMAKMFSGEIKVKDGLKEIQDQANKLLDEFENENKQ